MKNPMNDDDYSSNDEQIDALKDLVQKLAKAMATAVADLACETRGGISVSDELLGVLDEYDPKRELLREVDPESPLCEDAPGMAQ